MRIRRDVSGNNRIVAGYSDLSQNRITAGAGRAGSITRGTNEAGTSQSTAFLLGAALDSALLEGIFDVEDPHELQATYRDIYFHDSICGSAVDIQATMPWSDFTLTGANDDILDTFRQTLEMLNMKSAHEIMAKDRLVTGAFSASLIYHEDPDDGKKGFAGMIPYDYADCAIFPTLVSSQDPILRLTVPEYIKQFVETDLDEFKILRDKLPKEMVESFKNNKEVLLDPLSTLYLPRVALSSMQSGVSYYRRVLPCYLLERVLFRGTITEATKRQRSLTHIAVGATEDWIPTKNDMQVITEAFQVADTDPISAVVATRENVSVNEVMPHSDVWSWLDVNDQLRDKKMQALGISDSLLTPDGSFDTAQTALSVFIENVRSFRDFFTQKIYYEKLFPLISELNELTAENKSETAAPRRGKTQKLMDLNQKLGDTANLLVPEIQWHKQLRPTGDQEYMDKLTVLQEKGLPVPLTIWAAAAGINIEQLLQELEKEKPLREKIDQLKPPKPQGEEEGEFASIRKLNNNGEKPSLANNLLKRQYKEQDMEVRGKTKTGRVKYLPNQRGARRRINERTVKALNSLSDRNEYGKALSRRGLA